MIRRWEEEENLPLLGWDFSHIDGRWESPALPWDYTAVVREYLRDTDTLLDIGTGGGEVLLSLGHPHKNTSVTEAYPPNLELCRNKLSPLGITVAQTYDDDMLPFEDKSFDFIINRHESFFPSEVDRTLKSGGYFITQQVGNRNDRELAERLTDAFVPFFSAHRIENYADIFKGYGYRIIRAEEFHYPVKFFDVGALVFCAKAFVWEFIGFSVKSCLDRLFECQREIEENGFIQGTQHRFLLAAQKP